MLLTARVGKPAIALDTGGPLELADDAVRGGNLIPDLQARSAGAILILGLGEGTHHRANVRRRLGKNAGPALEVRVLISLNGGGPRLIEVVEDDVGVREDEIGVEMVDQVVADREVDPVGLGSKRRTILGASDNLELIIWTNTACCYGQ